MPRTLERLTLADANRVLEASAARAPGLRLFHNSAVMDAGGALAGRIALAARRRPLVCTPAKAAAAAIARRTEA